MYWIETSASGDSSIMRANLDGSSPDSIVTYLKRVPQPSGLALDLACRKVYWTFSHDCPQGTGAILRADLNGARHEELMTDLPLTWAIAVVPADGDNDGVADCRDRCPRLGAIGPLDDRGCPLVRPPCGTGLLPAVVLSLLGLTIIRQRW